MALVNTFISHPVLHNLVYMKHNYVFTPAVSSVLKTTGMYGWTSFKYARDLRSYMPCLQKRMVNID